MNIRLFLVPRKFRKFDSVAAKLAAAAARSSGWASTAVRVGWARLIAATVSLAVIAAWSLSVGLAEASAQSSPEAIPAEKCIVAPRTRQEIAALLADPSTATPAATTAGQTLPAGQQVTAETASAMDQTVRMWLACQNAGEPLRAWSLFSDG